MKPKETFWSGLKGGLFEEKHRKAMGEAIWFFGWLTTRQSQVNEKSEGLPHFGNPITDGKISEDTGYSVRNIRVWRDRLKRTGYIHTKRVGNLGLVYFIHKAKQKAKNPKPSTRYFPAELLPNGDYRARQFNVTPEPEVSQQSVTTLTTNCHTCADKSLDPQSDTQNTNTLTPKHLSNYNTEASVSSLLKKTARELQPPRRLSQADLDARRRELLRQAEEVKRKYPAKGSSPGKVVELQPKEATA